MIPLPSECAHPAAIVTTFMIYKNYMQVFFDEIT